MKKVRNSKTTRRLGVESLERREVLAGNVAVSLTAGLLSVTGNGLGNQVTIYQQTNGRFTVAGLDGETFTGPTANLNVRSISVNLQGGDDSVVIAAQPVEAGEELLPASVLGSVLVQTGQGSDSVTISVVGRLMGQIPLPSLLVSVDTGAQSSGLQNDTVAIVNTATSALTINTWGGQDIVDLDNVLTVSTTLNTGDGADIVTLTETASLTASVNLGSSSTTTNANVLTVDTGLFGTLSVIGGNGIDDIGMFDTLVGLSLTVFTAGGNDIVGLNTVQTGLTQADIQQLAADLIAAFQIDVSQLPFDYAALISRLPGVPGYLSVFTGEGNDVVTLSQVASTSLMYVYLEGGNDSLTATDVESHWAFFNGGAGTDGRFTANVDAVLSLLLFENVLPDPDQGGST